MLKYFFIPLFAFLIFQESIAQTFPVQVTTAIRPPYSLSLSDYANPAYDRIQTNIYMADLTQVNYKALMRLVIKGPGGIEISTKPGKEAGPIFLNGGVTEILTGAELNSLFRTENLNFIGISLQEYQRNAALPEGVYQFHFEVRDFNRPDVVVSTTNTGFATAWLILNDPPLINLPQKNVTIVPQPVQNIFFQWTPRHTGSPNAAFTTQYRLELVEIYPKGRNENDAMQSSPPIFETTTFATAYNYSMIDPYLLPDRWYAFRVKAEDTEGRDFFKNRGYSEVYKFYYGQECPLPKLSIEQLSENSLRLSWDTDPTHSFVQVSLRPKEKEIELPSFGRKTKTKTIRFPWIKKNETASNMILEDMDLTQPYEFTIQGMCQNNESVLSETYTFSSSTAYAGGDCPQTQTLKAERKTINNGKKEAQQLTLDWEDIPGAVGYFVYLIHPETGEEKLLKTSVSKVATEEGYKSVDGKNSFPDLLKVRIDVICQNRSSTKGTEKLIDLSSGVYFDGPCALPAYDGLKAILTNNGAEITWQKWEMYSLYTFRYRELGTAWKEIQTTDSKVVLTGMDPRKLYEYQLIYKCLNGEEIRGPINTFEITISPDYVSPNLPLTGDCFEPGGIAQEVRTGGQATITWEKEEGVKGYELLYREKGVSGAQWTTLTTKKEELLLTGLKENTLYEYQIRSACEKEGTYSRYTALFELNTEDVYTYIGSCLPPDSIEAFPLTGTHTRIDWFSEEYHTGFMIQLRAKGSNYWYDQESKTDPKIVEGLNPATTYEYKIASKCGVKSSSYSEVKEFTTLKEDEIAKGEFVCGMDPNNSRIENKTPIGQLNVKDKFTAADFEVEVKELSGGPPYNGIAMTRVPYLKNSYVKMLMEDVMVNTDNQMYSGRIIIQGIQLNLISEELKNKINGYITQINDAFDKADQALAYAQAIEDGLNEVINEINEPVDYSQYEGWTFEELMAEAKKLMNEGKAMVNSGVPDDLVEGLKMVKKAVELIKMATALGNKGVEYVEEYLAIIQDFVREYMQEVKMKKKERMLERAKAYEESVSQNSTAATAINESIPLEQFGNGEDFVPGEVVTPTDTEAGFELTEADLTQLKSDEDYKQYIESEEEAYNALNEMITDGVMVQSINKTKDDESKFKTLLDDLKNYIQDIDPGVIDSFLKGNLDDAIKGLIKQYIDTRFGK